ncbi:MBL fold metallo-hydrolase [Ruoffia sp. FAM 24228]|uniref:MBL fold metallo-hydrolase n=1 Tax=Lactobacillales TaxID=186826 RepID=UPI003889CB3E
MTKIRFWNGLDTIGGNIVEVATETSRVICDFGAAGDLSAASLDNDYTPLEAGIVTGLIPAIPNLFETSKFKDIVLSDVSKSTKNTAIFISHLHLDHMALLRFLPKGTDVYLSEDSVKLFEQLIKVGEDESVMASIRPFVYEKTVNVGDISVVAYESDHDVVGISALFIGTPGYKVIHSGDLRLNGDHPETIKRWVEKAKEWQPDMLLIEGTSFSFDDSNDTIEEAVTEKAEKKNEVVLVTEHDLRRYFENLLKTSTELLVLNPYIRNVERLKNLVELANKADRPLILEKPYATILRAFYPNLLLYVLKEEFEDNFTDDEYSGVKNRSKKDLSQENRLLNDSSAKIVTLDDIRQNPSHYVLQNSFKHLNRLMTLPSGSYLHSNGEPLGDYDPRFKEMKETLERYQFKFVSFGASGHASQEDLLKVATTIQAKLTVPWHTFKPKHYGNILAKNGLKISLPQKNKRYNSSKI